VIDCETGDKETLNMCNYDRHIFYIEDDDLSLDRIKFRFSIIENGDIRIRKSRFKRFMEKMKPIIEYDNEGYTKEYGEFVNNRYVLNYIELMSI